MLRAWFTLFALVALLLARVPALAGSLDGALFVVDPGHGTRFADGTALNVGAVGPSGVGEEAVVLAVAEDLAARLRAAGARVVLTRSHAHPYRVASDRAKDNHARAALANSLHATAFIAIHADGSTDLTQRGTSVFWLRANSTKLAKAMRAQLHTLGFGESQFRRRHLAVTDEARVPVVLVEIGFVSNAAQAHKLVTPSEQRRVAGALFAAINEVFASS